MKITITNELLQQIQEHGETSYPEEGAGLLLGNSNGNSRTIKSVLELPNSREDSARHNRYLITAQDMMQGEQEAMRLGLDIIGVFHSHPDHPSRPSAFDREWAMPWFSYLITRISQGKAIASQSWRLTEDRQSFTEETINIENFPS